MKGYELKTFEFDKECGKMKHLWSILSMGELHCGFRRNPMFNAIYCWYDGDQWALNLGYFWISLSH